jgi:CheY-like chemotaxis protein
MDLDLPVMDGPRVFGILRKNPGTSSIPFIFISDVVADLLGLKAGMATFLKRPFNPDEVYGRIRQVLLLSVGARSGEKEIEGKLSQMSLLDILQFLHLNKKEGELRVTAGQLTGLVYIKGGEVQNAVLDGVEKEKALFRLLGCVDGEFEFKPCSVQVNVRIRSSTSKLLMEGMRQHDELRKNAGNFPKATSRLKTKVRHEELPKGLAPVFYEVIQLLKIYSTVSDVVDHSTYPDYEVYKTLAAMISRGIVSEQQASAEEGGDFFTLEETLSIREMIVGRFSDIFSLNYARVLLVSTSGSLVDSFISRCARIPGFSVDTRTIFSQVPTGERFGEVARLRLAVGLDIVLFSAPTAKNMGPILKAFSTNLIGLIVLAGGGGGAGVPGGAGVAMGGGEDKSAELTKERDEILSFRDVPSVHVIAPGEGGSGAGGSDESAWRKVLRITDSEPLFVLDDKDEKAAFGVFQTLLRDLLNRELRKPNL